MNHTPRLLCPWDSPGKNTGVSCHAILQGIFLTHFRDLPDAGSSLRLLSTALADGFFTTSATWEAHLDYITQAQNQELDPWGN